jgi:hypothetical protein
MARRRFVRRGGRRLEMDADGGRKGSNKFGEDVFKV